MPDPSAVPASTLSGMPWYTTVITLLGGAGVLLGYARRILKLHGEVFNTLREPHMVGSVRIGTPGGDIEVARLGRGDVVGEIAILCDVPRTATVSATEPVTVLKITKELFFRLINEFPQIAIEIMRELAARLERTNAQLRDAVSRSAPP